MTNIENIESVWNYLKNQNADQLETQPPEKYGWLSVFCSFWQPASNLLSTELSEEKLMLIQLSKCSFIHEDSVHMQMLYTLFNKLTGLNSPAPLGTHWEIIGFQGIDPATDFRGVGILGLLQPLAASLSVKTLPFLTEVVNLSHSPSQGFPFMVLSLNVSNIVLKALRDGLLDRIIKQRETALGAVNICYCAILFYIFDNWKKEKLTLADCGQVMKRAETICKKEICQSVTHMETYLDEVKNRNLTPVIQTPAVVQLEEVQFHFISKGLTTETVAT